MFSLKVNAELQRERARERIYAHKSTSRFKNTSGTSCSDSNISFQPNFIFVLFIGTQASRQFDQEGRKKFFTLDMNNILLE